MKGYLVAEDASNKNTLLDEQLVYIYRNGEGPLYDASEDALINVYAEITATFVNGNSPQRLIVRYSMVSGSFIVGLVTLLIIRYAWKIQEYNDEVFEMLRSIPKYQTRGIQKYYNEGLITLREFATDASKAVDFEKVRRKRARKKKKKIAAGTTTKKKVSTGCITRRISRLLASVKNSYEQIGHNFSHLLLVSRLAFGFIVVVSFSLAIYFKLNQFAGAWATTGPTVLDAGLLTPRLELLFHHSRELFLLNDTSVTSKIKSDLKMIEVLQHSIAFGNSTRLSTQMPQSYVTDALFTDQACAILFPTDRPLSECETFAGGVFRSGLYTALIEYEGLLSRLLETGHVGGYSADFYLFSEFGLLYVNPMCKQLDILLTGYVEEGSAAIVVGLDIGYAIVSSVLFLSYWFIYLPILRKVDSLLRHNDSLPLLVPMEIMNECQVVKDFLLYG